MAEFELCILPIHKIKKIKLGERAREDYGDLLELKTSMKEQGLIQPIAVDQNHTLLAGGRRLHAALMLGWDSIPVIIKQVDTEVDALEIELFENIHRKDMTWQEEAKLYKQIDAFMREKHGDDWSQGKTGDLLNAAVGKVNKKLQIADILESIPELEVCKTEDDLLKAMKKMEEAVIVKELKKRHEEGVGTISDAVRFAATHYHIGDCFEGMAALENTTVKFIEVDPPYGIDLEQSKKRTTDSNEDLKSYTEVDMEEYVEFLSKIASETYRVANADCWMVFWYGPTWHAEVYDALTRAGWSVDDIPGIWFKGTGQTMQPNYYLARTYEPFFICRKGNVVVRNQGRSNVFVYPTVPPKDKYHPTQRPVELMEEIIQTFAYPGTVAMVPFLGSGVTLRALYRSHMNGFGYDLDEKLKDRFLLSVARDADRKTEEANNEEAGNTAEEK